MRKVSILALILVLALSLAACQGTDPKASRPTDNTGAATMPGLTLPTNIPDPSVNGNSTMPDWEGGDATGGNNDMTGGNDDMTGGNDDMTGDNDAAGGAADGEGRSIFPGQIIRSRVLRRF